MSNEEGTTAPVGSDEDFGAAPHEHPHCGGATVGRRENERRLLPLVLPGIRVHAAVQ